MYSHHLFHIYRDKIVFIKPPWTLADLLQLFDKYVIKIMGLLQLAITWYMLEGKLPTGTSKTNKIQTYLDEVALFWMSQWVACPPVYTM